MTGGIRGCSSFKVGDIYEIGKSPWVKFDFSNIGAIPGGVIVGIWMYSGIDICRIYKLKMKSF